MVSGGSFNFCSNIFNVTGQLAKEWWMIFVFFCGKYYPGAEKKELMKK